MSLDRLKKPDSFDSYRIIFSQAKARGGQLIFAKTLFCQKKVSYWKKSAILKNSKTFFWFRS